MFGLVRKILLILFFLGLIFLFLFNQQKSFEYEKEVLGTLCRLQIKTSSVKAEKISQEVFLLWKDIQDKTNILDPKSEISILNSKKTLRVSERLYELISTGYVMAEKTKGYLDLTIGTLTTDLFAGKKLSAAEIKNRLAKVNYKKMDMDSKTRTIWIRDAALKIDVWGFSKGYAADETIKILKKYGVTEALIDLGGQMTVLGKERKVSLEDPSNPGHIWKEVILKDGQTLATSNQVWQKNHLFVPGLKKRKENYISVSVIASQGIIADSLDTAIFVAGDESINTLTQNVQIFVKK